jgi:hypothetical protein
MTRRYVRLTLFVLLLLTFGGAIYQIALLERALAEADRRADASAGAAAGALDALLDMRASERAFLAEDQGAPYWRGRLDAATGRLGTHMAALRSSVATASTRGLFETTDEVLARLLRVEGRIGEHAVAGRRPHAEDLIFADALEASASVERDVRAAAAALAGEARLHQRDLRERELIVAALAAAVSMLIALLLVPIGREPAARTEDAPSASARPAASAAPVTAGDLPLNLRDATPGSVLSLQTTSAPAQAPAVRPAPVLVPLSASPPGRPARDRADTTTHAEAGQAERAAAARLSSAADLCVALARVQDTRDLPALLAHITRVLDAHGTIVWLADSTERLLKPALAHGYRDAAIVRLGAIAWDAPNPAADAFRRRDARLVNPVGGAPGAIIVPLVSASGCAGVVTIELKTAESRAGEPAVAPGPDLATLALARIFVAQLAGLIAPAAAAPEAADPAPQAAARNAVASPVAPS